MPQVSFDNPTALILDAALKAATSRAAKIGAWYATLSGTFDRPALYLIDASDRLVTLQLARPWERVGDAARVTAHDVTATAAVAMPVSSIVRCEIRRGTARMPIDRSCLTLAMPDGETAIPAGSSTIRIGLIEIDMSEIVVAGITPGVTPPPAGTDVPAAILAMASAPAPNKFTTGRSRAPSYVPNGAGDFPQQLFSGGYDTEYQDVFVGPDEWNLSFAGADPLGPISGNQYRGRVGIGPSVGGAVSWRCQTKLPTAAAISAYRVSPDSEVVCYPNIGAGRRLGGTAGWPSQQPGVIRPNRAIQFKNITSHWIGAKSWSLTGVDGGTLGTGWIAHDMRVCSSGRATTSYADVANILIGEVLVTRRHLPADRNLDPGATSGHYRGEHSIGGSLFRLFIQAGSTYTADGQRACLIQLRTVGGLPNHFPMHKVWEFLRTRTYRSVGHTSGARMPGQGVDDPMISPDSWYHQCCTGIEMEHDTYDLQVDTYYDRLNED